MSIKLLGGIVLVSMLTLAGCSSSSSSAPATGAAPAAQQKTGQTTKTGKILQTGEKFFLEERGKSPVELDSYSVELSTYAGKTVTVTGQYSGDTLFVSEVK